MSDKCPFCSNEPLVMAYGCVYSGPIEDALRAEIAALIELDTMHKAELTLDNAKIAALENALKTWKSKFKGIVDSDAKVMTILLERTKTLENEIDTLKKAQREPVKDIEPCPECGSWFGAKTELDKLRAEIAALTFELDVHKSELTLANAEISNLKEVIDSNTGEWAIHPFGDYK